ncbi:MAG TPA: LPS export ABC transporter periplasmic protein LptC [Rhizomicrobium sp.]|jgi:lipopolysaccharide export system protein LptC
MTRRAPQAIAEPLPQPGAPRAADDWGSHVRTTAQESLRYTRFVTVMKRGLFIAALLVLAAVLGYAMQPRPQNTIAITMQNQFGASELAMEKPHLTGIDNDGNPYLVTADKAIQDPKNTNHARLFNIDADLTEKKQGNWLSLTAPTGSLQADTHKLKLNGPIGAFSDDGYEFHTMTADVDLSSGIVRGSRMIVGQGPLGNMRADRFWLNRVKRLVFFNGNVRMTIYPAAMKKHDSAAKTGATPKTGTPKTGMKGKKK